MSKEEKDWDAEYAPEVSKRQNDVKGLLAKKDKKGALKAALVNPPVQSKNAQLKVGYSSQYIARVMRSHFEPEDMVGLHYI